MNNFKLRKIRKQITKTIISTFINLVESKHSQKDMVRILGVSRSAIYNFIKKYQNGDFENLQEYKTTHDKQKQKKKNVDYEKLEIISEQDLNPCTTLKTVACNFN
ncbi:hypothetical protein DMUE_0220 [Dictyocoela muelleri]|nr:hypothetical protein DMUE_0220 [Dictyocoela muelleri]